MIYSELCLEFIKEKQPDYKFLYTVLESSQNLFSHSKNNRKVYLWSLIQDNEVWNDIKLWKECIVDIISFKIDEAKRRV